MRCYPFTFGLGLGRPVAFRRPKQALVPSFGVLAAEAGGGDGEVVVKMGVRADDLEGLRGNGGWVGFAEYLG